MHNNASDKRYSTRIQLRKEHNAHLLNNRRHEVKRKTIKLTFRKYTWVHAGLQDKNKILALNQTKDWEEKPHSIQQSNAIKTFFGIALN